MPWPMVHFAIAANLFSSNPSPEFLVGSIAPDAVHVRGNITRKEKGATHLFSNDRFPSLEILQEHCLQYLSSRTEVGWKEYVLGYFAHIYADIRWTDTVYMRFERDFRGDKEHIRKTYNTEVSQVEFDLLRSVEWVEQVLNQLQIGSAYTMEPFVTQTEVSQYRDEKIRWLRNSDNEPKITPIYFTEGAVKEFIDKTSEEVHALYKEWGSAF